MSWTREDNHALLFLSSFHSQRLLLFLLIFRYVRIKRQNQTYFVMCTPGDTIGYLKEQVALATKEEYKAGQMRMILPKDNTVLEDEDKLEKHEDEITNETELHVVFQISEGEWESVYIEDTQAAIGGDAP